MKSLFNNTVLRVLIICSVCVALAFAQEELSSPGNQLIGSLEFVDTPIQDVLRVLALSRDLNYVIGPKVTSMVTVKLKNVSFETALEAVVTAHGYTYRLQHNFLRVDTAEVFAEEDKKMKDSMAEEQLITIVFELKFVNGKDILPLLETQLSPRGKILPVVHTIPGKYVSTGLSQEAGRLSVQTRAASSPQEIVDKIMVIDTVEGVTLVKKLLDEIDVIPVQILIESKMIESQSNLQSDLGLRWDFLGAGTDGTGGFKFGLGNVSRVFGDENARAITSGYIDNLNRTRGSLTEDDLTVLGGDSATVNIPDPIGDNFFELGSDKIFNSDSTASIYKKDTVTGLPVLLGDVGFFGYGIERTKDNNFSDVLTQTISNIATATLSATDFNIVLNALKNDDGVEIISNPSILTLDNNEASILVGERYPILKASTSETGNVVQSFDHYEPVGIQLQVLPKVMNKNYINMVVKPSVTSIGSAVGSLDLQINRINTREASTNLIVKSGDTIVIGGLMSDQVENGGSHIPFLGKIPLIGRLFSYKHEATKKSNLTVFVTPTIVKN